MRDQTPNRARDVILSIHVYLSISKIKVRNARVRELIWIQKPFKNVLFRGSQHSFAQRSAGQSPTWIDSQWRRWTMEICWFRWFVSCFAEFCEWRNVGIHIISAGATLATSIVQYYTALAMRSDKLFLINSTPFIFQKKFVNFFYRFSLQKLYTTS